MKKILTITILGLLITLAGCDTVTNDETVYTDIIKEQSLDIVGLPDVTNFFEMAQLKEIYELRDDPELITYWYTQNMMTGKWVYQGTCIGYGIPYGASITNPDQVATEYFEDPIIAQAEPNGLYTNTVTSSATWILVIDENGEIKPSYVEQEIHISATKIDVNMVEEWSIDESY